MPDMADELEFLWEAPLCETGLQHREEITTVRKNPNDLRVTPRSEGLFRRFRVVSI